MQLTSIINTTVCAFLVACESLLMSLSADDLQADGENPRCHILGHLRALTIPLRAAVIIVRSCVYLPPTITSMKAYAVVVTPDKKAGRISKADFDCFKAKFVKWCNGDNSVITALDGLKGAVVNPRANIHAEAMLMSLVAGGLQQLDVDIGSGTRLPLSSLLPVSGDTFRSTCVLTHLYLPQAQDISVGVSKRCCFCCWLLAELLQPQTKFVPHGTHGAIFPWSPPPGLPREILCTIRERLMGVLHHIVQASTVRPQSSQTSSALIAVPDSPLSDSDVFEDGLPYGKEQEFLLPD